MAWALLQRLIRDLERTGPSARPTGAEAARWDWYADGCPCGLPAGECREHPRARAGQRPPEGDWRTWLLLMGRGAGKTRSAAQWVRRLAESDPSARLALVGATAADVRDTMVEGESGILSISPPWFAPTYEPSKRRLTWPNGARATTFSADEPERLRGPNHSGAWCDELASWRYPAAWDNLLLGLRLGEPRICVTTTPKSVPLVIGLVGDSTTAIARGSTYDNRAHLAPGFFNRIVSRFEGTRLGQQELHGEVLEVSDGVWFHRFDPAKHVAPAADFAPGWPVYLAVDCGLSRHVGAVWFQVRGFEPEQRVCVFGDFHAEGLYSAAAAEAIAAKADGLPHRGQHDRIRLDHASNARSGVGPSAQGEFERVLGVGRLDRWPWHRVSDGLDQLEVLLDKGRLLIHPRCVHLIAAFRHYVRRRGAAGDWLDEPADPQHPHEDLIDALRGGVRDRFPEGNRDPSAGLRSVDWQRNRFVN